jgi:hypothetical protein
MKIKKSKDGTSSAARKEANACAHVQACEGRNTFICYFKARKRALTARKNVVALSVAYSVAQHRNSEAAKRRASKKFLSQSALFSPRPPA